MFSGDLVPRGDVGPDGVDPMPSGLRLQTCHRLCQRVSVDVVDDDVGTGGEHP